MSGAGRKQRRQECAQGKDKRTQPAGGRPAGRFTWRLAIRLVRRSPRQYALVAGVIAVTVAGAVATSVAMRSQSETPATQIRTQLGDTAAARLTTTGGTIAQSADAGSMTNVSPTDLTLEDMRRAALALLPSDTRLVEIDSSVCQVKAGELAAAPGTVEQADFADKATAGLHRAVSGHLPSAAGEVALSRTVAAQLGTGVGDQVSLDCGADLVSGTVVGVMADERSGTTALLGAGTAQLVDPAHPRWPRGAQWLVETASPVTWQTVRALNENSMLVVSRAVLASPPSLGELDPQIAAWQGEDDSQAWAALALAVLIVVGVGEAALLVAPALTMVGVRTRRQMGMLATQGARPRDQRRLLVRQSLAVGAASGVAGVAAGLAVGVAVVLITMSTGSLTFANLVVAPGDIAIAAGVALLIAWVGAWIPARRVARLDPVRALNNRGEAVHRSRRLTVARLVVLALGVAAGVAGVAMQSVELLLPGVILTVLGSLWCAPLVARALGRAAQWHWPARWVVPVRMAWRDAARNPGRSGPCIAGITGAVALAVAVMTVTASQWAIASSQWAPRAATGTVMVYDGNYVSNQVSATPFSQVGGWQQDDHATALSPLGVSRAHQAISDAVTRAGGDGAAVQFTTVNALSADDPATAPTVALGYHAGTMCPESASSRKYPIPVDDDFCMSWKGVGDNNTEPFWSAGSGQNALVVDDGTLVTALGLPGADRAAQALREGKIVLTRALERWPDGTAHLQVSARDAAELQRWNEAEANRKDGEDREPYPQATVVADVAAPAVVVDIPSSQYMAFIPPSVARQAALVDHGVTVHDVGFIASTGGTVLSKGAEQNLRLALQGAGVAEMAVARPASFNGLAAVLWAASLAALFIGVAVGWATSSLAVEQNVAARRTLASIGARPATLRRMIALSGIGMAGPGAVIGAACGLALGAATSWSVFFRDGAWRLAIPWPAVLAVVVIIALGAGLGPALTARPLRQADALGRTP